MKKTTAVVLWLAILLLATAFVVLAVAVRLAWQQVPPPPAAVFDHRTVLATSQAYGPSLLRHLPQLAEL